MSNGKEQDQQHQKNTGRESGTHSLDRGDDHSTVVILELGRLPDGLRTTAHSLVVDRASVFHSERDVLRRVTLEGDSLPLLVLLWAHVTKDVGEGNVHHEPHINDEDTQKGESSSDTCDVPLG